MFKGNEKLVLSLPLSSKVIRFNEDKLEGIGGGLCRDIAMYLSSVVISSAPLMQEK